MHWLALQELGAIEAERERFTATIPEAFVIKLSAPHARAGSCRRGHQPFQAPRAVATLQPAEGQGGHCLLLQLSIRPLVQEGL